MSEPSRGVARVANDNYPTPAWCVTRLLEAWSAPLLTDELAWLLEPCAGEGAIIRAVDALVHTPLQWSAVELRPVRNALLSAGVAPSCIWSGIDYLTTRMDVGPVMTRFDVAITNPPYALALPIAQKMLHDAVHVAVLTRQGFLASGKRAAWLRQCPPDVYQLPQRPSYAHKITHAPRPNEFRCDGALVPHNAHTPGACPACGGRLELKRTATTDACDYVWLVWGPDRERTRGAFQVLNDTPSCERDDRRMS